MRSDVVDLREFYGSRLGLLCERFVAAALMPLWPTLTNERLLGLGYATPWLDRFAPDAERAIAFMPAAQGAVNWPLGGPSATALVYEGDPAAARCRARPHPDGPCARARARCA